MDAIVAAGVGEKNDGRPTLSQLGKSENRGAHGLLDGKNGTDAELVSMADVTADEGTCGSSRYGDLLLVQVVLLGVGLQVPNGLGGFIHDFEVIVVGMLEKRVVDACKGDSLGVVTTQHPAADETRLVPYLEAAAMKVDHQRSGFLGIDCPEVEDAPIVVLAVAEVLVRRLKRP